MKSEAINSNCCSQASEAVPEGFPKVVLVGKCSKPDRHRTASLRKRLLPVGPLRTIVRGSGGSPG